ncbi:MAG: nucleotidyltransferase domain-containing protein [Geopsychrobacter sp.]|nr:nucleotidyltransferase domain-containing protein [Geopsychrobacter sp.]
MSISLEPQELKQVRTLLKTHLPNLEVRAFGSRVHGENLKPFSDLDLVIMNEKPQDPLCIAELREAFSESNLPFRVDILEWATISLNFRKRIEESCTLLLAKES